LNAEHLLTEQPGDQNIWERQALEFELPPELEAGEPPEARGLMRDEVRLMVSHASDDRVVHSRFRDLEDFLKAGDVLAINTSGTMNAALEVQREDGTQLELHLSTHLPADLWILELRRPTGEATEPFRRAEAGETLRLPEGAKVTLHAPYPGASARSGGSRLWLSTLDLPSPLDEYLDRHGFPIRYGYVRESWPVSYYQTVYATEMGSAEMPSAGRAFTPELITRLISRGVQFAPLILHTGVASLEDDEPPLRGVLPRTARYGASGQRGASSGPASRRCRDYGRAGARDRHGRGWDHSPG
jgi:S-adenosylmethionine:tRNA ribosyltransferase-isomerase